MRLKKSHLIAVEGIDGAGKTTLVQRLVKHLRDHGEEVKCVTRYMIPELTQLWHHLVEQDAVDQTGAAMLALSDHCIGLERCIRPALNAGQFVVADRYYYSHLVHFSSRGIDLAYLQTQFSTALVPDVVFYVAISPNAALHRLRPKMKPDFWEAGLDYRLGLRIGQAYRTYQNGWPTRDVVEEQFLAEQAHALRVFPEILPQHVTCVVDGDASPEDIARLCTSELDRALSL
jgi:dTMP kinase